MLISPFTYSLCNRSFTTLSENTVFNTFLLLLCIILRGKKSVTGVKTKTKKNKGAKKFGISICICTRFFPSFFLSFLPTSAPLAFMNAKPGAQGSTMCESFPRADWLVTMLTLGSRSLSANESLGGG